MSALTLLDKLWQRHLMHEFSGDWICAYERVRRSQEP